jgi:hypothetical protein
MDPVKALLSSDPSVIEFERVQFCEAPEIFDWFDVIV